MPEWKMGPADAGSRLDAWLARHAEGGSRNKARMWLERGKVFVNDQELGFDDASRVLVPGDRVRLWLDRPGTSKPAPRGIGPMRSQLRIVFSDAAVVVADKPPGLLVEPLPRRKGEEITLVELVADRFKSDLASGVFVVHRIDRDTSGLVLFARTADAQQALKRQFERRVADRVYLAVVAGHPDPPAGTWEDDLVWEGDRLRQRAARAGEPRARRAIAHYRELERFGLATLVEVSLVSGKRNQIRVQAGRRGHPLVGERIYRFGHGNDPAPWFPRQALHAHRLGFVHPVTGRRRQFSSPLPPDMERLLASLRSISATPAARRARRTT